MSRYKAYSAYRDSGIEWVGEIPKSWQVTPLFSVASTGVVKNDDGAESNVLSLSYGRIIRRDVEDNHGLLPESFNTYQIVDSGSIVLRLTDLQNDKRSLRVGMANEKGIITSAYLKLTAKVRFLDRYLYRLLHSYDTTKVFYGMGGGLRQSMKFEEMRRLQMLCPSLDEQKQIAAFLDHETAKIDALIEKQQRLIELLKEKRQTVISQAVTKGLNPNAPMKDSGVEWLGEVPAHWEVSQLRYVVREGTSITYGIVQAGPEVEDGVPYIRTSDMSGDALPLTGYPKTSPEIDASYARSKVNAGDLVISIRASVGKCLPVPPELDGANLTQGTAKIAPSSKALAVFMLPFIGSSPVQSYLDLKAKGATFKEITLETLRKAPFLVPPVDEQEEIGRWVGSEDLLFKALIETAEQAQVLLKERRTALISAAVTGKIDVRDWQAAA